MRFALPLLVAGLVAALAGYSLRKSTVAAYLPGWFWPVFWTLVGSVLVMVPLVWWLDF